MSSELADTVVIGPARDEVASTWNQGMVPAIRPRQWFEAEERAGQATPPHAWETTTDTIAAWVAAETRAESLWLLKSVDCPASIAEATRLEFVDSQLAHWVPAGLPIQWVNLRETPGDARPRRVRGSFG